MDVEVSVVGEIVLPDGACFAALISGYLAARAGLPIIPDAPLVRKVQLEQLASALPWAVRTRWMDRVISNLRLWRDVRR